MLDDLVAAPENGARVHQRSAASSALLLLVDGRLPTGGHAHSGGIESAVADGRVDDVATLAAFLEGKLATTGLVDASLVAATVRLRASVGELNAEAIARSPSAALRRASEAQARGLLRVARRTWPSAEFDQLEPGDRPSPLWPIVLGVVARAARVPSGDAALAAAQASIGGPAWAAIRLLGLDPYEVVAALAKFGPMVDEIAARADLTARRVSRIADLPAAGGPMLEIAAERHAQWEVRLFVS
jgi:urease accessory protein